MMGYGVFAFCSNPFSIRTGHLYKHIYNHTWFDYMITILPNQVLFLILQFKGLKTRCLTAGKPAQEMPQCNQTNMNYNTVLFIIA